MRKETYEAFEVVVAHASASNGGLTTLAVNKPGEGPHLFINIGIVEDEFFIERHEDDGEGPFFPFRSKQQFRLPYLVAVRLYRELGLLLKDEEEKEERPS